MRIEFINMKKQSLFSLKSDTKVVKVHICKSLISFPLL